MMEIGEKYLINMGVYNGEIGTVSEFDKDQIGTGNFVCHIQLDLSEGRQGCYAERELTEVNNVR